MTYKILFSLPLTAICLALGLNPHDPAITVEPEDIVLYKRVLRRSAHCEAFNARKLSLICNGTIWLSKPSQDLPTKLTVKKSQGNLRKITYLFRKSVVENAGPLLCYCEAEGLISGKIVRSRVAKVQHAYLSKPVLVSVHKYVVAGSIFTLTCQGDGIPQPKFSLYKETGKSWVKLSTHDHGLVYSEKSVSLVKQADINDSANYSCSASNLVKREFSETVEVLVYMSVTVSCGNPNVTGRHYSNITWKDPVVRPQRPPPWQIIDKGYTPEHLTPPWFADEEKVKAAPFIVQYVAKDNFGQFAVCHFNISLKPMSITNAIDSEFPGSGKESSSFGKLDIKIILSTVLGTLVVVTAMIVYVVFNQAFQTRPNNDTNREILPVSSVEESDSNRINAEELPAGEMDTIAYVNSWTTCCTEQSHFSHSLSSSSVTRNKPVKLRQNSIRSLPLHFSFISEKSCSFLEENVEEEIQLIPAKANPKHYSWGDMDYNGGRLMLEDLGITLIVPAGAIPEGRVESLYLTVLSQAYVHEYPPLDLGETHLSHVVMCGPNNMKFQKPVLLIFPHNARNIQGWDIAVKSSEADHNGPPDWKTMYQTIKPKQDQSDLCCIVEEKQCTVITTHFTEFCICGNARENTKLEFNVLPFSKFESPKSYSLLLYFVKPFEGNNGTAAEQAAQCGYSVCAPSQPMLICKHQQGGNADITCEIPIVNPEDWNPISNRKVLSYRQLTGLRSPPHVHFTLRNDKDCDLITCVVGVSQNGLPDDGVQLEITEQYPKPSLSYSQPKLFQIGKRSSSSATSMTIPNHYCIPDHIRHQLCVALDTESVLVKSWLGLAHEIGLGEYTDFLKSYTGESRTHIILEVFESRFDMFQAKKVRQELVKIFRKIERDDCVQLLENETFPEVFEYPSRSAQEHDEDDSGFLDDQEDVSILEV